MLAPAFAHPDVPAVLTHPVWAMAPPDGRLKLVTALENDAPTQAPSGPAATPPVDWRLAAAAHGAGDAVSLTQSIGSGAPPGAAIENRASALSALLPRVPATNSVLPSMARSAAFGSRTDGGPHG